MEVEGGISLSPTLINNFFPDTCFWHGDDNDETIAKQLLKPDSKLTGGPTSFFGYVTRHPELVVD